MGTFSTMTKNSKIFLFDVNHTLINTALYHTKALTEVKKNLTKYIDKEAAQYITKRFDEIFLLMVAGFLFRTEKEWGKISGGRKSYTNLVNLITQHQIKVKEKWGFIKKWSREVFIKIAADEIKVNLEADLIKNITTIYWDTITNLTEPFDEAKRLLSYIKEKDHKTYLLTSSDGRLQITKGFFTYDPVFSEKYKKNRMSSLRDKDLHFRDIIVGDPYDKPHLNYYKHAIDVIKKDLGEKIDPAKLVMIGNSFEDDLEIPILLFKFGHGFLFDKKSKMKKEKDTNIYRINNLLQIKDILRI